MARRKSLIVKELDLKEVEGYTEARIEHYLSLGYRPYLCENGKVKWLTIAQRSMRDAYANKSFLWLIFVKPFQQKRLKPRKRRRRSHLQSFIRANFVHIVIFIAVIIAALLLILLPYKLI